jgi:hypothetical protein
MKLPWRFGPALFSIGVCGANAPLDKTEFSLFRPTPRPLMREMSTDRPDQTESPYTVDAGHVQLEADLLSYTSDNSESGGFKSYSPFVLNLKLGVLNNVDIQLGISPWTHERSRDSEGNALDDHSGFGDLTFRAKVNAWGNDSGRTALAVMPFIKAPTATDALGNDAVEGGIIVPLAIEIPKGFGLGLMTEVDFLQNTFDADYHAEFINSITIGRDLFGPIGAYVEFFTVASTERESKWLGFFDLGVSYSVTGDLRFDVGVNIGVTSSAPDWNPFLGVSYRY